MPPRLALFEFDSPVRLCHSELHNPFLQERAKQRMTDLKGKTALVTGSTSGIGKATAIALAARGAQVLVVGRNEQRAKDVVAEIEGSGGSGTFRLTTLSDLESAQDLVEWATEAGDGHVDILINNAGVALLGPTNAATEAEFDETFAVNVKVPFFLVASLAPAMAERGWGSIVNVSTMVASFGQAGMAMYGASRAALELLTKAWAAEYGPSGVRVNAVAPGPTRTRMMEAVPDEMVNHLAALAPAGRVAEPEELAAAIVFLASDDASFVHGVTLAVDGGRVAT
jgi:NAD(P)-dependent dehydrogenase (short-subunit alcohol dehydrogenase family)